MASIIIAGDFCPHERGTVLIESQDYETAFDRIKETVNSADYSIVNLEAPIAQTECEPIKKSGPNLCCSDKVCGALKYLGFDMVTLANNHFRDYGDKACENTIAVLKKNDIETVGGGGSYDDAEKTAIKYINGTKVAIINCCEHEFSIAENNRAGSNPLDLIAQYRAIKEAKNIADYVMVIVHGGIEHYQLPTPQMQDTYRFFIDVGADVVVNHHQHCYSGYEWYKSKPIVYGLGNFFFDWDGKHAGNWTEGYLCQIDLDEKNIGMTTIPYVQCSDEVNVKPMIDTVLMSFNKKIQNLNKIIADRDKLISAYQEFTVQNSIEYRWLLSPYYGRVLKSLFLRGMLPHFLNKRKLLYLYNVVNCESHSDRLKDTIKRLLKS